MTDPFLAASNIGVEHNVCRLVVVLELVYQHVSEVRKLCYLFEICLQGLFKAELSLSSNWEALDMVCGSVIQVDFDLLLELIDGVDEAVFSPKNILVKCNNNK
eukprot:11627629-Ditylum_brightwellii.AAC.1